MRKNYFFLILLFLISLLAGFGLNEAISLSRYLEEFTSTIKVESLHFFSSQNKGEWHYNVNIAFHNPTHKDIRVSLDDPVLSLEDLISFPVSFNDLNEPALGPGESIVMSGKVTIPESLFRELRLTQTIPLNFSCYFTASAGGLWKIKNRILIFHDEHLYYF